ncbi:MAG TPA: GAF domain-containing protein [Azospirillaceae bacterium]|nr:GAF domain-containing protein [Azospirillaceae bacterium]
MPTHEAPLPRSPAQHLARSDHYHAMLRDFARIATDATDLDWLLDQAVRRAAQATEVAHAKLMRYRPAMGDLLVVAGVGWKEGVVGQTRIAIDMASLPGWCLQTRAPLFIGDIRTDDRFRHSDVLREHGIVSVLHAPIPVHGEVWGVVEVDSTTPAAFDERDERFFETFGILIGTAVQRRLAAEERTREAERTSRRLAEAETLMRETHHRVKNYFQIILSMVAMKQTAVATEGSRAAFRDVMDRIMAISLAHDLLRTRDNQTLVSLADYLGALCANIGRLTTGSDIEVDVEDIELRIDRAVPLGLILNELLTNSLKYAVKERPDGRIRVALRRDAERGDACLEVSDNGPGIVEGVPKQRGGAGLGIIRGLARQISGDLEIRSSPQGTTVLVRFPLVA